MQKSMAQKTKWKVFIKERRIEKYELINNNDSKMIKINTIMWWKFEIIITNFIIINMNKLRKNE